MEPEVDTLMEQESSMVCMLEDEGEDKEKEEENLEWSWETAQ